MDMEELVSNASSIQFILGFFSSITATIVIVILSFIFKKSIDQYINQSKENKRRTKLVEESLDSTSPYAPFAFGVAQSFSLKYFIIAVFLAYIGDIAQMLYPFNILFYIISLFFIWRSIYWLYKIEEKAIKIFGE